MHCADTVKQSTQICKHKAMDIYLLGCSFITTLITLTVFAELASAAGIMLHVCFPTQIFLTFCVCVCVRVCVCVCVLGGGGGG